MLKQILQLASAIIVCFAASAAGALFTTKDTIGNWYASLNKPAFNPPDWIFGPVWTILYLMMAVALFIIWNKGLNTPHVKTALMIFAVQLILNAAWTPIFFGAHQIFAALIEIIILDIAIIATILYFKKISTPATILLLPYLLWTLFATILTAQFYRLNG